MTLILPPAPAPVPSPILLPPSSYLPPIKQLAAQPLAALLDALHYLRTLYNPTVRGYARPTSSALTALLTDAYERAHAIRWLNALVRAASADPALEDVTQAAAALLALCAGPASAGTLTRTFVFPTPAPGTEVHVQLTDAPLENGDFGTVGAQTWGGACVLADRLARAPECFLAPLPVPTLASREAGIESHAETAPLRALELGAGTGLVSLALGKLLALRAQPGVVVATDVHPTVLANLRFNIAANFPLPASADADAAVSVSAACLDWADHAALHVEPFDLVLGADIVYEPVHAAWIRAVLVRLLRKTPGARFHLVVPLRPMHVAETRSIEEVFPAAGTVAAAASEPELCITSREVVECDGEGEGETKYYYYVIEWV